MRDSWQQKKDDVTIYCTTHVYCVCCLSLFRERHGSYMGYREREDCKIDFFLKKKRPLRFNSQHLCSFHKKISRADSHGRIHAKLVPQKKREPRRRIGTEREKWSRWLDQSITCSSLSSLSLSLSFSPMVPSFRMRFDLRRGGRLTFPNPAWPSIRTHGRKEGRRIPTLLHPSARRAKRKKEKGE